MASIEMNLNAWPVKDVLHTLLIDRTTKKNIIFATDSYAEQGQEYGAKNHITEEALKVLDIQPRVLKNAEEQVLRTRKKAEVFTPSWVCCLMNNHADEVWFKRSDVFGQLTDTVWLPIKEAVQMPKRRRWQTYVDARRLEITCGEAPYLVSRYDMGTGEIIPIENRVGMLDRKLRIVNENAETETEWLKWAIRSLQAVYGYEYQGDNLLIARVNLLMTFVEYLKDRWNRDASLKEIQEAAKVISWNIWQMDGLKGTIPMGALYEQYHQMNLFEMFGAEMGVQNEVAASIPSRIYDWRGQNKSVEFNAFREGRNGSMKFDFIIGNPPYQEETEGTSDTPVYNAFMDATYEIGEKVELITPARFLFDAGKTPKAWNRKMLDDEHLKVLYFEEKSMDVFANTKIRGGICVTYRDSLTNFGAIKVFSPFAEMNTVLKKVLSYPGFTDISTIMTLQNRLNLDALYADYPEYRNVIGSKGKERRFESGIFEKLPIFTEERVSDDQIKVYGVVKKKRLYRYFPMKYTEQGHKNLDKYKAVIMKSNGEGIFGEIIASVDILEPGVGYTQSYIGLGAYDTREEAERCGKYLRTKFLRALLCTKKVTQDNPPDTWVCVPLQDFTANSDIDWSVPIKAIDQQLYKKYGLSDEEISFIETHVKEMN